ncbi:hypothetical protein ZIOFF_026533 [Zingiber officinale]|uniref:Uncharacterized protein n=1 Tax=Zingiber officinale TaxID=94328 RepID=A0A8J5GXL0_ZINOF|nr:hypothetical protein ZIOFF_026533 [Zingiber officinale]
MVPLVGSSGLNTEPLEGPYSALFVSSIGSHCYAVSICSLNPRFVRRRLRHIAMRGCAVHRRFLYGSVSLLPATSVFSILPLPNVPFFWVLFRAYSHWRALKGSERLMLLVSDNSKSWSSLNSTKKGSGHGDDLNTSYEDALSPPWV